MLARKLSILPSCVTALAKILVILVLTVPRLASRVAIRALAAVTLSLMLLMLVA